MTVRIPADVDRADRVLFGLTLRQLGILAATASVVGVIWLSIGAHIPSELFLAISILVVAAGVVWALGVVDGAPLETLAVGAVRHFATPPRRVLAPEGVAPMPEGFAASSAPVSGLEIPCTELLADGLADLGASGLAVAYRATPLNFALRSHTEQRALVEAFGRLLNSLEIPVQFLSRCRRTDLRVMASDLDRNAERLGDERLKRGARAHAAYLRSLSERADVLTREMLVVLRDPRPEAVNDPSRLQRHADQVATRLRDVGVSLEPLQRGDLAGALAGASAVNATRQVHSVVSSAAVVRGLPEWRAK